ILLGRNVVGPDGAQAGDGVDRDVRGDAVEQERVGAGRGAEVRVAELVGADPDVEGPVGRGGDRQVRVGEVAGVAVGLDALAGGVVDVEPRVQIGGGARLSQNGRDAVERGAGAGDDLVDGVAPRDGDGPGD